MTEIEPRRRAALGAFLTLASTCVGLAAAEIPFILGHQPEEVSALFAFVALFLTLGYSAALLAAAVTFLLWFHRAHKNLGDAGLEWLEFSSAWAVGGFFVPFLNLVRPYAVMKEVWQGSDWLASSYEFDDWRATPPPPLILRWWLLYLGSNIVAYYAAKGPDFGWLWFAAYVTTSLAAVVAMQLIYRVSEKQTAAQCTPGERGNSADCRGNEKGDRYKSDRRPSPICTCPPLSS